MKAIEKQLPLVQFVRVHRSYIINLAKIERIVDNTIIVKIDKGNKSVPIGKAYKENFMKCINLMGK
jgi:two-component system response regulator LytT